MLRQAEALKAFKLRLWEGNVENQVRRVNEVYNYHEQNNENNGLQIGEENKGNESVSDEESKFSEQRDESEAKIEVMNGELSNETLDQYLEFDSENPISTNQSINLDSQLLTPKNNEPDLNEQPIKLQKDKDRQNDRKTVCLALIATAEERNQSPLRQYH